MPHVTVQYTCTFSSITNKRQDQFFIEHVYSRPRNLTKGRGDIISVYTGSGDGATRCFDAKSAGLKRTFKGHENTVNSVQVTRLPYVSMHGSACVLIWECLQMLYVLFITIRKGDTLKNT